MNAYAADLVPIVAQRRAADADRRHGILVKLYFQCLAKPPRWVLVAFCER